MIYNYIELALKDEQNLIKQAVSKERSLICRLNAKNLVISEQELQIVSKFFSRKISPGSHLSAKRIDE